MSWRLVWQFLTACSTVAFAINMMRSVLSERTEATVFGGEFEFSSDIVFYFWSLMTAGSVVGFLIFSYPLLRLRKSWRFHAMHPDLRRVKNQIDSLIGDSADNRAELRVLRSQLNALNIATPHVPPISPIPYLEIDKALDEWRTFLSSITVYSRERMYRDAKVFLPSREK